MSHRGRKLMASSKPRSLFLRSTSAVTLHQRFSQVLVDQLTRPSVLTLDPRMLPHTDLPPVVLLVKSESPPSGSQAHDSMVMRRSPRRPSIWTRLGWQVSRRLSGFWSFRNKYIWRARISSARRKAVDVLRWTGPLIQRSKQRTRTPPRLAAEHHLSLMGGATGCRGRGLIRKKLPSKKQLDAQLDDYMSLSKSRLDKQLDDYMSMSKTRLDAELDEYMSLAGRTQMDWD